MKKNRVNPIARIKSSPCVTISMNTPGHQSDNSELSIELRRLLDQAKFLVMEKYEDEGNPLIKLLDKIQGEISFNNHLESLTIFLSDSVKQIITSMWPVNHNRVQVADRFDIRSLVTISNNTEEYYILLLSHKKVRLLYAINNEILSEVKNEDFPIVKELKYLAPRFKSSDENEEEGLHQFFSTIDKKLIRLYNHTWIRYVIISSEDNYERFMEVSIFPSIYAGHVPISNDVSNKSVASGAWNLIKGLQKQYRISRVKLMKELIDTGRAITDKHEILNASREGRGDLLILNEQAIIADTDEDLMCEAVWEVINRGGNVILASQDEIDSLGNLSLKLKY